MRIESAVCFAGLGLAAALRRSAGPLDGFFGSGNGTSVGTDQGSLWKVRDTKTGMRLVDALLDLPAAAKEAVRREFLKAPVRLLQDMQGVPLAGGKTLPRAKACAMVSSSRALLEMKVGKRIDEVDGPVLRFNLAPTEGYQGFVGNRTDIVAVNEGVPCWWAHRQYPFPQGDPSVLLNGFLRGVRRDCLELFQERHPNVTLYSVDYRPLNSALMELMKQVALQSRADVVWKRVGGFDWITTGMVGAALLLNMCEEVRHYGFLPLVDGAPADDCREHYWQEADEKCGKDKHHRLNVEHLLWAAMSQRGAPGEGIVRGIPRIQLLPFA